MRKPRSVLVFLLLLVFGMCLAVPAEDAPETSYNESETLPYESRPVFSIVKPQASAQIAKAELSGGLRSIFSTVPCKHFQCVAVSLTILERSFRC